MASWVLLAVFLPMFFMSLHVHPSSYSADYACTDGVRHQCRGHIGQQVQTLHYCVLCQFFSVPMVAAPDSIIIHQHNHYADRTDIFFCHLKMSE